VTLLLNREVVSIEKLCLVSVFPDIVKDCPKMRSPPKIFLRSFENVAPACKGNSDVIQVTSWLQHSLTSIHYSP